MSYLINFIGGVKQYPNGALFKQTSSSTVANTVTETTLIDGGQGTLTLPANFFKVGRGVRLTARGFHSSTGNPSITIRFKLGGTTVASGIATSGNGSSDGWEISVDCVCRSEGVSGTVVAAGYYDEHHTNGAKIGVLNTSPVTIDTTTSKAVDLTVEWGAASASNTITTQILLLHAID